MQPFAKSYHQYRKGAFRHSTGGISYTPVDWSRIYQFPVGFTGKGQNISIIELGGGFVQSDYDTYRKALGFGTSKVNIITVGGAQNSPGDPNGADGEVMLDVEVAGCCAPDAQINLYFGPNTDQGMLDTYTQMVKDNPDVLPSSWGAPEDAYPAALIQELEAVFQSALAQGTTLMAAVGDNGSSDGEPGTHVDFPGSSPSELGCGGTSRGADGVEVVWNNGPGQGATGGGISNLFSLPSWQGGLYIAGGGKRGVPDVAGDADPNTGVQVLVDGQAMVIGGTSAVAPMWAGLVACLNQALGKRVGFLNPLLYAMPETDFNDILTGNNGTFIARPLWDACTGLGTPKGQAILAALQGGVVVPPVGPPIVPPPIIPPPIVPPSPVIGKFAIGKPGVRGKVIYRLTHGAFVQPVGFESSVDLPAGTYNITK